MKKLDKLILGSFIGPFLLTFLVVDFILLIVNMLKYFDEIFGKGLGFWIYAELISYFVISISPMALPLAVLLSSLMTFGNLGEHFELTAIKSSGISLIRAMRPIGIFAVFLTILAFLSNNYLVPKVNLKTFSLLYDIRMKSPALDIKEGVFYAGIPNYSIKVNQKLDDIRLKDIIIYNHAGDEQGNLNVTLADSGRMETFFNDSYLKLTLYNGQNYKEARATRGISEPPVEFSRTKFDENVIVFDLDAFQLSRTPEDLWSTNRAIKNISEIKLGLDSINTIVNDLKFQNYQTAESIYPFFTKNRKLTPPDEIKRRKQEDDEIRRRKILKERQERDSLLKVEVAGDSARNRSIDSLSLRELKLTVASTASPSKSDSLFQNKLKRRGAIQDSLRTPAELVTTVDTTGREEVEKNLRTEPLNALEKKQIDSLIYQQGYLSNAMTMALNNSRNLKNTFNVKMSQVDSHEREYRRYEIALYQKYTQAIACFVMFLIGAPLGSIIKKGGLGMPVLISIVFFILFYMLTITGEKWAKEGLTDSFLGTIFSNLCLFPFGLFFLRQARKDARLFEADFYSNFLKKLKGKNSGIANPFKGKVSVLGTGDFLEVKFTETKDKPAIFESTKIQPVPKLSQELQSEMDDMGKPKVQDIIPENGSSSEIMVSSKAENEDIKHTPEIKVRKGISYSILLISLVAIFSLVFITVWWSQSKKSYQQEIITGFKDDLKGVQGSDQEGNFEEKLKNEVIGNSIYDSTAETKDSLKRISFEKPKGEKFTRISSKSDQPNFYIIVASWPDEQSALESIERFQNKSSNLFLILPNETSSNYRVAVGQFNTWNSASVEIEKIKAQFSDDLWILSY